MAMQILVVAATEAEIEPLTRHFNPIKRFDVLITGVGMVATAFALGGHLQVKKYDLVINLGIAGCFNRDITLGEVVEVTQDELSELGAEDNLDFLPITKMGFGESRYTSSSKMETGLRKVNGITVNTVHGNEESIDKIINRLKPQLESMEGAAFFYACEKAGIPCLQIRAVSNYVEKRNRDNWQIGLAIKNLNNFAVELLEGLISGKA